MQQGRGKLGPSVMEMPLVSVGSSFCYLRMSWFFRVPLGTLWKGGEGLLPIKP